jgi:integrase
LGSATTEAEARAVFTAWVTSRNSLKAERTTTVAQIFAAYQVDRAMDGKQVGNIANSWVPLAPVFGPLRPDAITADLCRAYAQQRLDQGVSVGTVWTELGRLRTSLNWALARRTIATMPYVWVPTKPSGRTRVLTPDEADRLVAGTVMPHVRLFVILAIATGARTAALLELEWSRVDLEARTIDLSRQEPENPLSKATRKGRAKAVYINDWARAALSEARDARLTENVIEWNGGPVQCIRTGFRAACRRAGIDGVTPHDLRRTAATWLADQRIDMERIARFLGHSNPSVTRSTYAHPKADREAGEVVQLHPAKRAGGSTNLR